MSQPKLPPSYDEAMNELEDIKINGIPQSSLDKAHKAMAEKAAAPATGADLLKEIEDLAKRVIAMDRAFEDIRVDFGKFDANDYVDKHGKPVEKFQPTWTGYQTRFTDLLWASRKDATATEGYVREFANVIIPIARDNAIPLAKKKQEILTFIKRGDSLTRHDAPKPGTHSHEFTNLVNDVRKFTNRYLAFANDRGVEVSDKIKTLNQEISTLDARIAAADKLVIEMGIAMGATVVGAGIGLLAALATIGTTVPAVLAAIFIAAIGAVIGELAKMITALKDANDARRSRREKQAEVDRLTKELKLLQELKSALNRANEDIVQTLAQVDNFSTIAGLVIHDAQLIGEYLSKTPDGVLDESALWNIKVMEATYTILHPGLKKYATLLDKSKIFAE